MAAEGGDGGGDDNPGESLGVTSKDGWGRAYKGEEVLKINILGCHKQN